MSLYQIRERLLMVAGVALYLWAGCVQRPLVSGGVHPPTEGAYAEGSTQGDEEMRKPPNDGSPVSCPVHAVKLKPGVVRIVYGLIRAEPAYSEASRTRFPYARTFVSGGCFVDYDRTEAKVEYCPECRTAQRGWQDSRADRA